jgi:predicted Zn-ribbon and HTH transcriptional regulator
MQPSSASSIFRSVKVTVSRTGWQCERCGHQWVPLKEGYAPAVCPKCKSPYWNRPRRRLKPGARKAKD